MIVCRRLKERNGPPLPRTYQSESHIFYSRLLAQLREHWVNRVLEKTLLQEKLRSISKSCHGTLRLSDDMCVTLAHRLILTTWQFFVFLFSCKN